MNWHWLTWLCSFISTINRFWTVRLCHLKKSCMTYLSSTLFSYKNTNKFLTKQLIFWKKLHTHNFSATCNPSGQVELSTCTVALSIINTLNNRCRVQTGWIEVNLTITLNLRSWLVFHCQVTSKRISKFFCLYIQNRKLLHSNEWTADLKGERSCSFLGQPMYRHCSN